MKFTIVILGALLCLNSNAAVGSKDTDEALEAAANQLIAEGGRIETPNILKDVVKSEAVAEVKSEAKTAATTEVATGETSAATADLKESEIPVTIETKKAEKNESNLIWRMVASIGVVLVVAGAATFAGKKYRRNKDKGGQKARIEIMHQLHLGPKKSIGLIRVAGEALLVGITDQNITMLKSVALIDDELENAMGKNFNNFLEDEFSIEDVRNALNPRA